VLCRISAHFRNAVHSSMSVAVDGAVLWLFGGLGLFFVCWVFISELYRRQQELEHVRQLYRAEQVRRGSAWANRFGNDDDIDFQAEAMKAYKSASSKRA